jgi:hypothetical protein
LEKSAGRTDGAIRTGNVTPLTLAKRLSLGLAP